MVVYGCVKTHSKVVSSGRCTSKVVLGCSVSVELESPVVVVPRSARSTQVLVAHLGRMSLANRPGAPTRTTYKVRIRDISLVSVSLYLLLFLD